MQLFLVFLCVLCASAVNFFDFFFVSLRESSCFVVEVCNLGILGTLAHFRHLNSLWFSLENTVPRTRKIIYASQHYCAACS
jgi:hypothetical protein